MVINHPAAHRLDRPVTVMVAAAPPSPTLFARMSELNFRIVHVYGLTETYGPITVCPDQPAWSELAAEERAKLLARQGQAYISSDLVRVVDEEMNDVATDGETMGEVVMRGNNVMSGYFDDQEATAQGVRRRLVSLRRPRPSGTRTATSSCATAARTSSSPAARTSRPSRSSRRSSAHPAVLECAVVGIPHEHWGERPKAFVTLNEGARADPPGDHRLLPRAPRALQVPGRGRVRPAAQDLDRQGAEVRPARARVGWARHAHRRGLTTTEAVPSAAPASARYRPRWCAG